jgi:hypothetical protein
MTSTSLRATGCCEVPVCSQGQGDSLQAAAEEKDNERGNGDLSCRSPADPGRRGVEISEGLRFYSIP